jgi:hypothetical protein
MACFFTLVTWRVGEEEDLGPMVEINDGEVYFDLSRPVRVGLFNRVAGTFTVEGMAEVGGSDGTAWAARKYKFRGKEDVWSRLAKAVNALSPPPPAAV